MMSIEQLHDEIESLRAEVARLQRQLVIERLRRAGIPFTFKLVARAVR